MLRLTKRTSISVSVIFLLSLFFCIAIFSYAEEVADRMAIFVNELPERGQVLLKSFETANKNKDYDTVAKYYQQLLAEYGDKVVENGEKRFVLLRTVLNEKFLALGDEAIKAFRDSFDPIANSLKNQFEEGDFQSAIAIIKAYPYSTYAPHALAYLASVYADSGKYQLCASSLGKLLESFPEYFDDKPGLISLYAVSLSNMSDAKGVASLLQTVIEKGWGAQSFAGATLAKNIEKLAQSTSTSASSEWCYPSGNISGSKEYSTTVDRPALLWRAPTRIVSDVEGSFVEKDYEPYLSTKVPTTQISSRPLFIGDKMFVSDGYGVYSRDIETGLALCKYPLGTSRAQALTNQTNSSSSTVYSLSIDQGKLFFTSIATSIAYSSSSSVMSYNIEGADEVFSAVREGSHPLIGDKERKALAGIYVISVPIAIGGQVIAIGKFNSGMSDVYAFSFDASTGELIWMTMLFTFSDTSSYYRSSISCIPVVSDGKVYFSAFDTTVSLSIDDGEILWIEYAGNGTPSPVTSVEPPIVLEKENILISMLGGSGIRAYDLRKGALLWKSIVLGSYMGHVGNSVYFIQGATLMEISAKTGEVIKSGSVQFPIIGVGAVTKKYVFLPSESAIKILSRETFEEVSETKVPGESVFLGRIIPNNDKVFCITPEMIYCFGDLDKVKASHAEMIAANEKDPIPHYKRAMLKYNSGDLAGTLESLRVSISLATEADMYLGYKLVDLLRYRIATIYRMQALAEADKEKVLEFARQGLQIVNEENEKFRLQQIVLAVYIGKSSYTEAIDYAVEMIKAGIPASATVSRHLGTTLTANGIMLPDSADSCSLDLCLRLMIKVLAFNSKNVEIYEKRAAELEEQVLAGDSNAAVELFRGLYFTHRARVFTSSIAKRLLDGEENPVLFRVIRKAYSSFSVSDCPELVLVKALDCKEKMPSAADQLIEDVLHYFADAKFLCGGTDKPLSHYALNLMSDNNTNVVPEVADNFADGLVKLWTIDDQGNSSICDRSIRTDKGIVVPLEGGRKLACLNPEDGEPVWVYEPPEKAFIGVNLQDSKNPAGSLVVKVIAGLPAEISGVLEGDVIVEFNGEETPDYISLVNAIAFAKPEEWVKMKVIRGGEEVMISIKPTKRDDLNAAPDSLIELFPVGTDCAIAIFRSSLSAGFRIMRFQLDDGSVIWEKKFLRSGYPSKVWRHGNLIVMTVYDYRRTADPSILVFDSVTANHWSFNISQGAYTPTILSVTCGRIAVATGNTGTLFIYDLIGKEKLLEVKVQDLNYWNSEYSRYIPFRKNNGTHVVVDVHDLSMKPSPSLNGASVQGDFFYIRTSLGGSIVSGADTSKELTKINNGSIGKLTSDKDNLYAFVYSRNTLGMGRELLAIEKTGKVLYRKSLPASFSLSSIQIFGKYLVLSNNSSNSDAGCIILEKDTGKMVFITVNTGAGGFSVVAAVGEYLLIKENNTLSLYRVALADDVAKVKENIIVFKNMPKHDRKELISLCQQLYNLGFYSEMMELCDIFNREIGEVKYDRTICALMELARAGLARYPILNLPTKTEVKYDGKLDDWGTDGWIAIDKYSYAIYSATVSIPEDEMDLSARINMAVTDAGLAMAIEVTDDQHEPNSTGFRDSIDIYFNGEGEDPDSPASALSIRLYSNNFGVQVVPSPQAGYQITSSFDKARMQLKGGCLRDDENNKTIYEVLIPWEMFRGVQEVQSKLLKDEEVLIRFNVAVLDGDTRGEKKQGKVIELAPSLYSTTLWRLRQSLFPAFKIPTGVLPKIEKASTP